MGYNEDIGKRIRNRRKELDMSVDELADKLGKNRATIYRYENGEVDKLPIDVFEPLAMILQTTPAQLLGWNVDRKDEEFTKKISSSNLSDSDKDKVLEYIEFLKAKSSN